MTKQQFLVIFGAIGLFLILYFGFDIKTSQAEEINRARSLNTVSTNIEGLFGSAKEELTAGQLTEVLTLEKSLEQTETDSGRVSAMKALSSTWYQLERFALAGHFANEIAEIEHSEIAWSIAGSTFFAGIEGSEDEKVKALCAQRSVEAFENAVSLNPGNVSNKINLALTHVAAPPSSNPMQGILMLRRLSEEHPANASVFMHLGRLAINTNQFERAVERLEKALDLGGPEKRISCLLTQAYSGIGQMEKAAEYQKKCN